MAIEVGIIGLGNAGRLHMNAVLRDQRLKLVAVAENDANATERLPDGVKCYANWRDLIGDAKLDAVCICLPHHLHFDVTCTALQSNCHVLLEKPIAHEIGQARELTALAASSTSVSMVEMTHRFYPPMIRAQAMIASGQLGDIYAVEDRIIEVVSDRVAPWLINRSTAGGGVALTNGIHVLDRIAWSCGQPLQFLAGVATYTHRLGNVEDTASMQLALADGAPVNVLLSWPRQGNTLDDELTIYASKGTLRVWAWRGWRFEPNNAPPVVEESYPSDASHFDRAAVGIRAAVGAFAEAVVTRSVSTVPLPQVLAAHELIEQFYRYVRR